MDAVGDPVLLAIDTATTQVVVALGALDGTVIASSTWEAGYRHGETLLPAIERQLADETIGRERIAAIVVGTGPGAFTGLRVGLATAKGLAHGLGRPIVGVPTGSALLGAIARGTGVPPDAWVLLLPAGPSDRLVIRAGRPAAVLPAGEDPVVGPAEHLAALDLAGRAPEAALAIGGRHRDGLSAELLRLGAARLALGDVDDLARLVPEYVTSPRGAVVTDGEVAWSRDPR